MGRGPGGDTGKNNHTLNLCPVCPQIYPSHNRVYHKQPASTDVKTLPLRAAWLLVSGLGRYNWRIMELLNQTPANCLPPEWLVAVIRSAEQGWQASLPPVRRLGEASQEHLARLEPALVAAQDFSIGTCSLRPSAARRATLWALEKNIGGFLGLERLPDDERLVAMILEPAAEARLVLCLLGALRESHPGLRDMHWEAICGQDALVAKLYSGYMGAGGAWEAWQADLTPGPEALRRLDFQASAATCTVIQRCRPHVGAAGNLGP